MAGRYSKASPAADQRGVHQGGHRPFGCHFGSAKGCGNTRELSPVSEEHTTIGEIVASRRAGLTLMAAPDPLSAAGFAISRHRVADIARRRAAEAAG